MRQHRILFKNLAVRIEVASRLNALRERLVLQHLRMVLTLSLGKVLRPVVVALDIRDSTSEGDLSADLTFLDGISKDISGRNHDFPWVLLVSIVLLDLNEVRHVLIS